MEFITTNYDALTDAFTAYGFAQILTNSSGEHNITGAMQFDLDATIDGAGDLIGGSFTITGAIAALAIPNSLLLQGTLTQLGFDTSPHTRIEFFYDVTGGALASLYQASGAPGGIIMTGSGLSANLWQDGFGNSGNGLADVGVVLPEPGSLVMLALIGAAAMIPAVRRRRGMVTVSRTDGA